MSWVEKYERWKKFEGLNKELKDKLLELEANKGLLEDCFYKDLEFGTGGMRGELGPGTNRMNIYTIRKAADGLARFIESNGESAKKRGVVIAYDSRHQSQEFAMEAAKTLSSRNIKTYVFDELRPTPELSFAVRELNAFSGIVITASHNPPEYNGFKVYDEHGCQLTPDVADKVIDKVNEIENELYIKVSSESELKSKGLIKMIGEEIDKLYIKELKTITLHKDLFKENNVHVVFTPLHGTANKPVRNALDALGFNKIEVVTEQELPDPSFSTVKSPNPEEHAAFELAIKKGIEYQSDLLIGTDPDADRLGIAVKDEKGEYTVLTGNQTGALLLDYLLSQRKEKGLLPENGVVLKTIVTSELGREIARSYGLSTIDTLTGFKFIGEKINEFEKTGKYQFQFGFEESYGYLIKDICRDKDAIQAAISAVELASFYKAKGLTIFEALQQIFNKYGFYQEALESLTLKGKEGLEKIQLILTSLRKSHPKEIAAQKVVKVEDFQKGQRVNMNNGIEESISLPSSNVLKYYLNDGTWICARPSGTEPKIKFYFGVKGSSYWDAQQKLTAARTSMMEIVDMIIK